MNRTTMGQVRKLKTSGTGVYLWADSLQPGNPPSLLGRPILEIPDLHSSGGSPAETVVGFGDWNAAFRIFDRTGLTILRDPYSGARTSTVVFHARRRVDSALVRADAVRGLKA
jgi:HK97 family phage major capsid protein